MFFKEDFRTLIIQTTSEKEPGYLVLLVPGVFSAGHTHLQLSIIHLYQVLCLRYRIHPAQAL
jgi:hypothetical protein